MKKNSYQITHLCHQLIRCVWVFQMLKCGWGAGNMLEFVKCSNYFF